MQIKSIILAGVCGCLCTFGQGKADEGISSSDDVKNPLKEETPLKDQKDRPNIDPRWSKKCASLASSIFVKAYENGKFIGIVLIERGRPPLGAALPGGLIRYEETAEGCAKRTLFDECGIPEVSNLQQFHVYSDPQRDPRMHVIDTVFTARIDDIKLSSGTDAKRVQVCAIDQIPWDRLCFDHREILRDCLNQEMNQNCAINSTEKMDVGSISLDRAERNKNDFNIATKKAYHPPFLAASVIIEVYEKGAFKGIILIERGKEPLGMAIPGGHVEYGEQVGYTAQREMREECSLELKDLRQFKIYSSPDRDPRKHTIDVIHIARVDDVMPKAGDDAAKAFVYPLDQIPWEKLVFDHAKVLKDYIAYREGSLSNTCVDCFRIPFTKVQNPLNLTNKETTPLVVKPESTKN